MVLVSSGQGNTGISISRSFYHFTITAELHNLFLIDIILIIVTTLKLIETFIYKKI